MSKMNYIYQSMIWLQLNAKLYFTFFIHPTFVFYEIKFVQFFVWRLWLPYILFLCWYHMSISVVVLSLNYRVWCCISTWIEVESFQWWSKYLEHICGIIMLVIRYILLLRACTKVWPLMTGSRDKKKQLTI